MSLETLLAAANFLEAQYNGELARGQILSPSLRARHDTVSEESSNDNCYASSSRISECGRQISSSNPRQMHNELEKNRRAVMKECFDDLRRQIPCADYGRSSNLKVLRVAIDYVQALQSEGVKLEQFHMRLLERNLDLKKQLRNMETTITQVSYIASSPSTDTADDSPYLSDSDYGECSNSAAVTSTAVVSHQSRKKQAMYSAGTRKCDELSKTSSADMTTLLDVSADVGEIQRQNDAVAVLASLSSGKTVGVKCSDDTTTSLPSVAFSGADQLNQRSVNSLEAKSFQKLLPVTDDGFAGRATSSKANENRTVVQLLQNALVQRKAIKQTRPRARVANGKQRNHCNTISQQIAALKALEASQLSASAISQKRMESENDDFVAVVKEPQTLPSETTSAVDCKMVLSSGASMEGYLSSANLLVTLSGDQLVATSQLLNPSPELQKVCTAAVVTRDTKAVSTVSHPSIVAVQPSVASPFILYPMMFSNVATAPLLVAAAASDAAGATGGTAAIECGPSVFRALHPVSMLQMPTVIQSSSVIATLQPVTMVTAGDLASHVAI